MVLNVTFLKIIFICFVLTYASVARSQDLIIKKDGKKIYCQIVNIDSTTIYYTIKNENPPLHIQKSEITSHFVSARSTQQLKGPQEVKSWRTDPNIRDLFKIELSGGTAKPLNHFANMDAGQVKSGMAKLGWMAHLRVTLMLNKYIGLSATYRQQRNKFNHEAFDNYLKSIYHGSKFTSSSTP